MYFIHICIMKKILSIFIIVFFACSCKENGISISEKEYKERKGEGFWVIRNKKAINHNLNVAKPKRDRQMKKLARENKQIEKYNAKQRKHLQDNTKSIRTFGNGAHYKTFEHH